MLVGVLTAQALNFLLILVVPPPSPPIYTLADVAGALSSGRDPTGSFEMSIGSPPDPAVNEDRTTRLRLALAGRLGAPREAVRLVSFGPRPFREPRRRSGALTDISPPEESGRPAEYIVGRFTAALQRPDGTWRILRPTAQGLEPWQWAAMFWLIGAMIVVAPLAWLLSRRIAAPIGLFAAAADRFGRDPDAPPFEIRGPKEIVAAASAFNAMQQQLQRYVADRTTMVAAVAHDLRTPLMRLTFHLATAPSDVRARMEADVTEMKDMIDAILDFVRGVVQPIRRQRLELRSLVESVADELVDLGHCVRVIPGDDVVIEGAAGPLKTMFVNLIGNAAKFATQTDVQLRLVDDHAMVQIKDDGPGIPEDELDRVFEPFYRLEPSRSRATGGSGLGLASARAVARAHGGDVILINRNSGGLVATVCLPSGPREPI